MTTATRAWLNRLYVRILLNEKEPVYAAQLRATFTWCPQCGGTRVTTRVLQAKTW